MLSTLGLNLRGDKMTRYIANKEQILYILSEIFAFFVKWQKFTL